MCAFLNYWQINSLTNKIMKKKIINYSRISSGFGYRTHPVTNERTFHNGLDLVAEVNTPILAPFNGIAVAVYIHATGGQTVILKSHNGDRAGFCHLNDTLVKVGDRVRKGIMFAKSGNSGRTTGPHLHYTYTPAEDVSWTTQSGVVKKWSDPKQYLTFEE